MGQVCLLGYYITNKIGIKFNFFYLMSKQNNQQINFFVIFKNSLIKNQDMVNELNRLVDKLKVDLEFFKG